MITVAIINKFLRQKKSNYTGIPLGPACDVHELNEMKPPSQVVFSFVPRLLCVGEEKEPGIHCLRMLSTPMNSGNFR